MKTAAILPLAWSGLLKQLQRRSDVLCTLEPIAHNCEEVLQETVHAAELAGGADHFPGKREQAEEDQEDAEESEDLKGAHPRNCRAADLSVKLMRAGQSHRLSNYSAVTSLRFKRSRISLPGLK